MKSTITRAKLGNENDFFYVVKMMMIALTCLQKWKSNTQIDSNKKRQGKFHFLGRRGRQTCAR